MNSKRLFSTAWSITSLLCLATSLNAYAGPPRQAWAHQDHLIDLQLNGKVFPADNALDRLKIQELFSRWGIAWDEGRLDVVESLFTSDAEYLVTEGSSKPIDSVTGNKAIAKRVGELFARQSDQRRHAISNVVIESLESTKAKSLAVGVVTVATDTLYLGASVIYTADIEKGADQVWRFRRLVIGMDKYVGFKPSDK